MRASVGSKSILPAHLSSLYFLMSRIPLSDTGSLHRERLHGRAPEIPEKRIELASAFFSSQTFSKELRLTLVFDNWREYCVAKAGPSHETQAETRTSLAVGLAQLFVQSHQDLDEHVFAVVNQAFSEKKIAELFAFMVFLCVSQMSGALLGLKAGDAYEERAAS